MISTQPRMIGVSDKQVAYAQKCKHDIAARYPGEPLPDNPHAKFWIDNKDATPEQLCRLAYTEIYSPFTTTYPKYTRDDVVPLLKNMYNFAVFDTETSGLLNDNKSEIVEMTIICVTSEEVLFNSLFKPHDLDAYFNSKARKMHGYTEEDYKIAPTFRDEWETIRLILDNFHLVAYNASFDFAMLKHTALLWDIPFPPIKGTCAMKMFEAFMNTEFSDGNLDGHYKLKEACDLMGIDQEKFGCPHTSLADTLALRELLLTMRQMIETEEQPL